MKRFACLAFVLVAACGDDGTTPIDAANIDAAVDAAIDAPIDAPVTVYSGTLTALEVAVLNPGATGTFFGQGIQLGIGFGDSVTGVAATMEEQPGSPLGCKLFNFTRAQAIQATVGNNEGSVQVTVTQANAPVYPACTFTAGVGYTCPQLTTAGNTGTIATVVAGATASLTVAAGPYTDANSVGRYVSISGATNAANNGVFPIVARPAATTIVYGNPAAAAEALPAGATRVNLAGVGPIPMAPDPGFFDNAAGVTIALTPGGGNHFTAFTSTTGAGNIGDDFQMPMAERIKLNAIPANGAAFTVTCGGDVANPCGNASGSLLNIVTTDSAVVGLSPFSMPLPTTRRVQVRCAQLGSESITVPAAYMAAIMGSGATRIQTTFMRPLLMSGGPATVNSLGGHAIVGFTTR